MKVQNTITFIISRNYGRALSASLPAWAVVLAGVVAVVLLVGMLTLSFLYVASYTRFRQVEQERRELLRERDALREQIHSANQGALERKERLFLARFEPAEGAEGGAGGSELSSYLEDLYQPPIVVASLTTRVTHRTIEVAFRLVNQGDENNRGGFLYAIFENDDRDPTEYQPSPAVKTNAEGFPQTYKSGVRFTRIRNAVTFRRRVRRGSEEEYFTHVTLYLFSVRGGLLIKERFELDRELFSQDQPAVRTQHPSTI